MAPTKLKNAIINALRAEQQIKKHNRSNEYRERALQRHIDAIAEYSGSIKKMNNVNNAYNKFSYVNDKGVTRKLPREGRAQQAINRVMEQYINSETKKNNNNNNDEWKTSPYISQTIRHMQPTHKTVRHTIKNYKKDILEKLEKEKYKHKKDGKDDKRKKAIQKHIDAIIKHDTPIETKAELNTLYNKAHLPKKGRVYTVISKIIKPHKYNTKKNTNTKKNVVRNIYQPNSLQQF